MKLETVRGNGLSRLRMPVLALLSVMEISCTGLKPARWRDTPDQPVTHNVFSFSKGRLEALHRLAESINDKMIEGARAGDALAGVDAGTYEHLGALVDYELKTDPTLTKFERLRFMRRLSLLREISPALSPGHEEKARLVLAGLLLDCRAWEATHDLDGADIALRTLYRLQGHLSGDESDLCRKEIRSITAKIGGLPAKKILDFLDTDIKEMGVLGRERRLYERERSLRELVPAGANPLSVPAIIIMDRLLEQKEGLVFYENRGPVSPLKWYVEIEYNGEVNLRNSEEEKMFIRVPAVTVVTQLLLGKVENLTAQARHNYETENSPESKRLVEQCDLPKGAACSYVSVFPARFDRVISTNLISSAFMCKALGERGVSSFACVFTDNCARDLKKQLQVEYASGSRIFFVDLYAHGSNDFAWFGKGFSPKEMGELVKAFPDCRFMISTMSCYGAGLREGMLKYLAENPSDAARIDVFLCTKPRDLNEIARIGRIKTDALENNAFRGSYFGNHWISLLLSRPDLSLGACAHEADIRSKKDASFDAEQIIKGKLITINSNGQPSVGQT